MDNKEIGRLLQQLRKYPASEKNDYKRLRNEEWRCIFLGFSFLFLAGTFLRQDFSWLNISGFALLAIGAIAFIWRGCHIRKACRVFEEFCPRSFEELEQRQVVSASGHTQEALQVGGLGIR